MTALPTNNLLFHFLILITLIPLNTASAKTEATFTIKGQSNTYLLKWKTIKQKSKASTCKEQETIYNPPPEH